jgi:hypothetical protein
MDDYSALAQRIAVSVGGVSGALILSRDGLVLGAYPNEDESLAKPAWLRFIALGEPERSFIEFPDQVWAYVKRGPYAAFATAEAGTRPGVLVDQMEQVLLVVEEGRTRREPMRVPDANAAPSGKPRTSLHPQFGKPAPAEAAEASVSAAPSAEAVTAASQGPIIVEPAEPAEPPESTEDLKSRDRGGFSRMPGGDGDGEAPSQRKPEEPVTPPAPPEEPAPSEESAPPAPAETPPSRPSNSEEDDSEVDPVLLAKEFSGLLQLDSDDDE